MASSTVAMLVVVSIKNMIKKKKEVLMRHFAA